MFEKQQQQLTENTTKSHQSKLTTYQFEYFSHLDLMKNVNSHISTGIQNLFRAHHINTCRTCQQILAFTVEHIPLHTTDAKYKDKTQLFKS